MKNSIMIADTSLAHIKAIITLLKDQKEFSLWSSVTNWNQVFGMIGQFPKSPGIFLLDFELGRDHAEILGLIERIKKGFPHIRIIIQSMFAVGFFIYRVYKLDVAGFLLKDCQGKELILALQTVIAGGNYYQEETLEAMNRFIHHNVSVEEKIPYLTRTEERIIRLFRLGYLQNEIRFQLNLSDQCYQHYWCNIYRKFGSRDPFSIVNQCVNNKLLPEGLRNK